MESSYRLLKINKEVSFGDYHARYVKKELNEKKEGVTPVEVRKESLKVTKGGEKVKLRKKEKLALIEALKEDNLDRMHELLQSVKPQSS